MADDYSVELQGHVFSVSSPRVRWSAQATHRLDTVPPTLAWWDYTIELEGCRVRTSDGTADKAQEALGAFLAATIHKATVPTYLKILDIAAQPIDEIGNILPGTGGWEELLVTAWNLPPSEEQLLAGAEFNLTATARRVFADGNDLVFARRSYSSAFGDDGLEVRTLRTEIRMKAGTSISLAAGWLLTLIRQPAPATWVRPLGGARGFDVDYPNRYGLTDEAIFTSVAKNLGGGVSPPIGSSGGSEGEVRREAPELGLVRLTLTAEAVGTESSTSWVDGRQPANTAGQRESDFGGRRARGSWERWEAVTSPISGRVFGVVVERELEPGGQDVSEAELTGQVLGPIRVGPVRRWRLIERVIVSALGPTDYDDVPTLKDLGTPWVAIPREGRDGWRIADRGPVATQDRWERTTLRVYLWDGTGNPDPRETATVRALLLKSYRQGDGTAFA